MANLHFVTHAQCVKYYMLVILLIGECWIAIMSVNVLLCMSALQVIVLYVEVKKSLGISDRKLCKATVMAVDSFLGNEAIRFVNLCARKIDTMLMQ